MMGHLQTRKNTNKQGKTFSNKEKPSNKKNTNKQGKPFQTRKTPINKKNTNKQWKHLSINKKNTFQARKRLSSKGYLPIKCKSLQVVGVSRQGKAVVSDGMYGVIGG